MTCKVVLESLMRRLVFGVSMQVDADCYVLHSLCSSSALPVLGTVVLWRMRFEAENGHLIPDFRFRVSTVIVSHICDGYGTPSQNQRGQARRAKVMLF